MESFDRYRLIEQEAGIWSVVDGLTLEPVTRNGLRLHRISILDAEDICDALNYHPHLITMKIAELMGRGPVDLL